MLPRKFEQKLIFYYELKASIWFSLTANLKQWWTSTQNALITNAWLARILCWYVSQLKYESTQLIVWRWMYVMQSSKIYAVFVRWNWGYLHNSCLASSRVIPLYYSHVAFFTECAQLWQFKQCKLGGVYSQYDNLLYTIYCAKKKLLYCTLLHI